MRCVRTRTGLLALGIVMLCALPAQALETGKYLVTLDGVVRAVEAGDLDGDGRTDLIVLTENEPGAADAEHVVVLLSPAKPVERQFFPADHIVAIDVRTRFPNAGAVAVGRFGPNGEIRIRLLGPDGVTDLEGTGTPATRSARHTRPTLLTRSTGHRLVFWDAIADLDGDGRDEVWFPDGEGNGRIRVLGGTPAGDRLLSLEPANEADRSAAHLVARHARVPRLVAADLDGDGSRELVALDGKTLVAWSGDGAPGGGATPPSFQLALPFLEPDPNLAPEELRTPRIQLDDVDGDGVTDLLVTLISGRRDRLGSLRTTLFHYPGPFRDAETGQLVAPRARIDTESVALHPTFVDLDGDQDLDYVGDSIRGNRLDLIARIMGQDPAITFVGFRYDASIGTFESTPYFTEKREFASAQALSNTFGRSAWFGGDFDGDGIGDLVDLGNLSGVAILRGVPKSGNGRGDPLAFSDPLVERLSVKGGLAPGCVITDLSGDGQSDAVLWSDQALYLIVPKGRR